MAILDLPYQNIIDRESSPSSEGFGLDVIQYSSKVSQRSFNGPSIEASRNEIWKVVWNLLEFDTKGTGVQYDLDVVRDFYRLAQVNKVRWKPFEIAQTRIWRVVENSLKVKNTAGNIFSASFDLEFLYNE